MSGPPLLYLPSVSSAALTLTNVRTPPAGATGNFTLTTRTAAGGVIDVATWAGVTILPGALRAVAVAASTAVARSDAVYTFTLGTTGRVPAGGRFDIAFPPTFALPAVRLVAFAGFGAWSLVIGYFAWQTFLLVGSIVTTTSDRSANSFSVSGAKPPTCWTKLLATSRRESLMLTGNPAFTRQAAIGQPILPAPMKPTLCLSAMLA